MIVIHEINRTPEGVNCKIGIDGNLQTLVISLTCHAPNLRGMDIVNLSTSESYALSNRDEFKDFQKVVWRYLDGGSIHFPFEVQLCRAELRSYFRPN